MHKYLPSMIQITSIIHDVFYGSVSCRVSHDTCGNVFHDDNRDSVFRGTCDIVFHDSNRVCYDTGGIVFHGSNRDNISPDINHDRVFHGICGNAFHDDNHDSDVLYALMELVASMLLGCCDNNDLTNNSPPIFLFYIKLCKYIFYVRDKHNKKIEIFYENNNFRLVNYEIYFVYMLNIFIVYSDVKI